MRYAAEARTPARSRTRSVDVARNTRRTAAILRGGPVGDEQERHDEGGGGDELEEAASRVLRVRQPGRDLDEAGTAEQVAHLHGQEGEEQAR
jgi:hypothetical protein